MPEEFAKAPPAIVSLTTDFGLSDGYVAAMKGVILSRAPQASIVDISHQVRFGDVAEAAYVVAGVVPTFPEHAIHVVVVDPGVGSDRRLLYVEAASGRFLAPDNGVLSAWLADAKVRSVENSELFCDGLFFEPEGSTFHGRDRFAPLAAALINGIQTDGLGPEIVDPLSLPRPLLERGDQEVVGTVIHIDHFGNAITNIPWSWLEGLPRKVCTLVEGRAICRRVDHYAALPDRKPGFLCGSRGTLEIALKQDSIANDWSIERGTQVRVGIVRQQDLRSKS